MVKHGKKTIVFQGIFSDAGIDKGEEDNEIPFKTIIF